MQIPQQQRRLLSRRKIEVNRGPVESSFKNFFRRFVKAQKFSEQPAVVVEGVYAVKKVESLFQTLVMQECFMFQPGQDHIGSLAVIESGLSNLYANNLRRSSSRSSISSQLSSYLPNCMSAEVWHRLMRAGTYSHMRCGHTPHNTRRPTTKTSGIPQNMSSKFNP